MYIPPLFSALRQTFTQGYTLKALRGDISAGLTVGIIAIPLAMALAIAVGVPPQHGLYTVLIGGSIIALTGGSRFNVSGPNRCLCRDSTTDYPAVRGWAVYCCAPQWQALF